MYKIQNQ